MSDTEEGWETRTLIALFRSGGALPENLEKLGPEMEPTPDWPVGVMVTSLGPRGTLNGREGKVVWF